MPFDAEIARNALKMKKCKKIWSYTFYVYLVGGIFMIMYSLTSMTGVSWDWFMTLMGKDSLSGVAFLMIADYFVVAPLGFFLAFKGSYGHSDLGAMLAPVLNIANLIFVTILRFKHLFDINPVAFYISLFYSSLCIGVSVFNIRANYVYHQLETQRGFPHFNERFIEREEEQNMKERMKEYKDTHKSNKKIISDMDDVSLTGNNLEKYEHVHQQSTMDDI